MRSLRIIILVIILLVCKNASANEKGTVRTDCEANSSEFDRTMIISRLRLGGFSGILNQKTQLTDVGHVKVRNSCIGLVLYLYTSKVNGKPSGAVHMAKRLLVFVDSAYVGMYSLDELPIELKDNILLFPGYKEEGNYIKFDAELPPKKIYLGGQLRELEK